MPDSNTSLDRAKFKDSIDTTLRDVAQDELSIRADEQGVTAEASASLPRRWSVSALITKPYRSSVDWAVRLTKKFGRRK